MATVQLFATYRSAAGTKGFDTAELSVSGLLDEISRRYPVLYDELCDTDGSLRPLVKMLVNGRHIQFLDGVDTPLADEDVVSIFPPIAGG